MNIFKQMAEFVVEATIFQRGYFKHIEKLVIAHIPLF